MRVKEMIRTMMSMTTTVQALKTMGIAEIVPTHNDDDPTRDGDPSKYLEPRDHEQSVGVPSMSSSRWIFHYASAVRTWCQLQDRVGTQRDDPNCDAVDGFQHPRKSTRQIPRFCFGNIGLVTKILQCSHFLGVKWRFQRWCFFSI